MVHAYHQTMSLRSIGHTDANWAGDNDAQKHAWWYICRGGGHWIKSWSKGQIIIALNSAESEFHVAVKVVAGAFGVQALYKDAGRNISIFIMVDASADLGIIKGKGVGKVRRIEKHHLWIQEAVAKRIVEFNKIQGAENLADLKTQELSSAGINKYVDRFGAVYAVGGDAILKQMIKDWDEI